MNGLMIVSIICIFLCGRMRCILFYYDGWSEPTEEILQNY